MSHRSPIAAIKAVISEWRRLHGWSRETVTEMVVAAHTRIGGPQRTGIHFSHHHDVATRQKTNADRVYRWMNDEESDRNLLAVNMLPSILAALPSDLAAQLLNEILGPAGFAARVLHTDSATEINPAEIVRAILASNHRTELDATALLDGVDPGELPRLHAGLMESIRASQAIALAVESAMRRGEGT
nr:hypothetical protein [Paraburkholderia bonniea]